VVERCEYNVKVTQLKVVSDSILADNEIPAEGVDLA